MQTQLGVQPSDAVLTRQALHASLLGFEHPSTGDDVTYVAPLPEDMRSLIRLLREQQFVEAPTVAGTELDLEAMLSAQP